MKYAIHPDYVISKADGDVHYVSADRLIYLYGVRRSDCLIIDDRTDRHTYARRMQTAEELGLIHLWPRFDGIYMIPEKS